jgi:hypothetical protein
VGSALDIHLYVLFLDVRKVFFEGAGEGGRLASNLRTGTSILSVFSAEK